MSSVDEITFNQILKIFTKRWKFLVILALAFLLAALTKHKYFPMYPGSGKLIIKDAKNSQLQMVLSAVASMNLDSALDTKGIAQSISVSLRKTSMILRLQLLPTIAELKT